MIRRLFLVALLCCFAVQARASAGFNSTYGSSGSDVISMTYTTPISSSISLSAWFVLRGIASNNFPCVFANQTGGLELCYDANGGIDKLYFQSPFSSGNGVWFVGNLPTSTSWHHMCLTYNNSSLSNVPTAYLDGILQTPSVSQSPSGTPVSTMTNIYIGNVSTVNQGWDGAIGDVALWNGAALAPNDCLSIFQHTSPLKVHGGKPEPYLPLYGSGNKLFAADWGPNHIATIVSGAKAHVNSPTDLYTP
jgi:hypothetical protein